MKNYAKRIVLLFGLIGTLVLSGCDGGNHSSSDSSSDTGSSSSSGSSSFSSSSSSSSGQSSYDCLIDSRYPGLDFNTYGAVFREKLASLITGKTTSYNDCKTVGMKAAAYPNANSSTFIPFYHEAKSSEVATSGESNREHCWPKSRGGNMIENDPIVIRPTVSADNSARGNYFYGNEQSNEFDPASKTSNGSSYEGARGEAARIILYAACRYYSKGLTLSNNPSDNWNQLKTMGTLKTLLKWNMQYLPTEWEKTVNDRYANMGYARNPFVEHPEYANFIWDVDGLRTSKYTITICGGDSSSYSSSSSVDSSSQSSSSSSSSQTSSSSSSEAPSSFKKTFTISDWPSEYSKNETTIVSGGVNFSVAYCGTGYTTGSIQMKKGGAGYFYNTSELGGYDYIALKTSGGSVPLVTYGDSSNPTTASNPTLVNGYHFYDISKKPFFKISSGDGVSYINEFHMA